MVITGSKSQTTSQPNMKIMESRDDSVDFSVHPSYMRSKSREGLQLQT